MGSLLLLILRAEKIKRKVEKYYSHHTRSSILEINDYIYLCLVLTLACMLNPRINRTLIRDCNEAARYKASIICKHHRKSKKRINRGLLKLKASTSLNLSYNSLHSYLEFTLLLSYISQFNKPKEQIEKVSMLVPKTEVAFEVIKEKDETKPETKAEPLDLTAKYAGTEITALVPNIEMVTGEVVFNFKGILSLKTKDKIIFINQKSMVLFY